MKDLSEQIEELRHTLRPSTELAHERVTSLELQMQSEYESIRKRIKAVTQRARQFQSDVHSDLVELAGVFGIYPTTEVPPPLPQDSIAPRFANGHAKLQ